jgi:HK97 gp10 family phage protein
VSRGGVKVIGLENLRRKLAEAGSATHKAAQQAVAEEVEATRDDARRLAPVKTGALRAGIRAKADDLEGEVKSTVRYATFVEHGTYRDKAQPHMAPAAALSRRRLPKRAAQIIRAALEEIR